MPFQNILDKTIPHWYLRKIGDQTFDDLFQIEGTPLRWFYSRLFIYPVLPNFLNSRHTLAHNWMTFALKNFFFYNSISEGKLTHHSFF